MLEALGVPTSRSFSLIETGEDLERADEPSPTRSAVLVRLSWSHIRFGSFQRHAFFERPDRLTALTDHVLPAQEDVAGGLHQALPGDDPLAVVGELALARVGLDHRPLRLLDLEEQRIVLVAADEQGHP